MFSEALLVLLAFTWWDKSLLKKQDKNLFLSVFEVHQNIWLGFLFFIGWAIIFDPDWYVSIELLIFMFVFPIYFVKRFEFLKQSQEDNKFWLVVDGMRVVLYWFFGILLFSTVVHTCNGFFESALSALEEMVATAVFSSALLMFLIEKSARSFKQKSFWRAVGFSQQRISFFKKVVLPIVLGLGMAYFSATIIVEREFQPSTPLSEALEADASTWAIPVFVILALVVAPLVEEITFRGYFFEVLRRVKGQRVAFYVIALTFGALHMGQYWGDWAAIVVIMVMGFLLTFIRVWAKTTAASVTMHYFYNIGVIVIAAILEMSKEVL